MQIIYPPLNAAAARRRSARRGFTLTELLVVIAIIAMLVAIVSVGVTRALATARQTAIKTELDQIDAALKEFKSQYGSYPPADLRFDSMGNPTPAVRQFVARAFPRYNLINLGPDLRAALGTGMNDPKFRPDQALVLWLSGFSGDPMNPFVAPNGMKIVNGNANGGSVTRSPLFSFDTSRLVRVNDTGAVDTDVPPSYFPPRVAQAPYVYWDWRSYGQLTPDPQDRDQQFNSTNLTDNIKPFPNAGTAAPYAADQDNNGTPDAWQAPEGFQLVAAGMDGQWGVDQAPKNTNARVYPQGTYYNLADNDNVTNFSQSARLESDKP